jgi:hypothetical protein
MVSYTIKRDLLLLVKIGELDDDIFGAKTGFCFIGY